MTINITKIVETLMEFAQNPGNDDMDNFYDFSNEIEYFLKNITFSSKQEEQIINYINNREYFKTQERERPLQY